MKSSNLEKGRLGEAIAKDSLEKKGYKILEQNCRQRYGEIDLIAKDKETLVFVEVRTKGKEEFGTPEQSLNRNKILRIIKNAQIYLARKGFFNVRYRIDAVCLVLDEKNHPKRINHYENINF